MPSITPFLWFDDQAEDAATYYVSVFPNSAILDLQRYGDAGPGQPGKVMTVRFRLDGTEMVALNGGPSQYGFNLGVSLVVSCATPEDVDHYWEALGEGGAYSQCGWLTDRWGLPWQIVPEGLPEVLGDPDPARAQRAMAAMLTMSKLDLPAMRAAADGT